MDCGDTWADRNGRWWPEISRNSKDMLGVAHAVAVGKESIHFYVGIPVDLFLARAQNIDMYLSYVR